MRKKAKYAVSGEEWRDLMISDKVDPQEESDTLRKAREGIEKYRKIDVEIAVVDRSGNPVAGKEFDLVQLNHAFPFGDQLWELDTLHRFNQADTERAFYFKERFKEVFNSASALCYWTEHPRNDGPKIEDVQGRNVTEHFEYCVDWAASQGLTVKGHPLFWSIYKCVPEWVKRYDYRTQMKFAEVRVRNLVARFKGRIRIWDAVNEALWEPTLENLPERHWPHIEPVAKIADMIEEVLGWAHDEDPDATYLVNDYGLEDDPAVGPPMTKAGKPVTAAMQRRRFVELIRELSRRKAAPTAIGLQSHSGGGWVSLSKQTAVFDELSRAGLPLHVTEFWAHTKHLEQNKDLSQDEIDEAQGKYVSEILTCAFGHPSLEAFFFWGFMGDSIRWDERLSGHRPKPMFTMVRNLIGKEWRTSLRISSDKNGKIRFRGFKGDYSLRFNGGRWERGSRFSTACSGKKSVMEVKIS